MIPGFMEQFDPLGYECWCVRLEIQVYYVGLDLSLNSVNLKIQMF